MDYIGKNSVNDSLRTKYRAEKVCREYINDGQLRPIAFRNFATWNIEGFSLAKLVILEYYMDLYNIDLICLQETHMIINDHYVINVSLSYLVSRP